MRKKRSSSPTPKTPAGPDRSLVKGECVAKMNRPNILVPLEPDTENPKRRFPLLRLQAGESGSEHGVFFDPKHGRLWWDYTDRAPTWMDPHLFADMCLEDEEVQAELRRCLKRNDENFNKLEDLLDAVMENVYLVHVLEQFEAARPLLAEWLARNHASKEIDDGIGSGEVSRRRRRS